MKVKRLLLRSWLGLALLACASFSLANDQCAYKPPTFEALPYREGNYLPVYFSSFQLSLPSKPVAFLSTNGFIAVYPDKGSIGIDHVAQRESEEVAPKLAPGVTSISSYYRLIYGAPHAVKSWSDKELSLQRSVLGLDCSSGVHFFNVDGVEILFHKADKVGGINVIVVLNGDDVELITVRGSEETAVKVISSIKRRL